MLEGGQTALWPKSAGHLPAFVPIGYCLQAHRTGPAWGQENKASDKSIMSQIRVRKLPEKGRNNCRGDREHPLEIAPLANINGHGA